MVARISFKSTAAGSIWWKSPSGTVVADYSKSTGYHYMFAPVSGSVLWNLGSFSGITSVSATCIL